MSATIKFLKSIDIRWLIVGIVLGYYYLYWRNIQNYVNALDECNLLFCDFVRHFYVEGNRILVSSDPVGGFYYSAFAGLLFRLVSFWPRKISIIIWGCIQVLTILSLIILPDAKLRASKWYQAIYLFLVVTSLPLLHNFKWGQVSLLLTVAIVATFYFYNKGNLVISALLLALAISIKYYPAVFLLYFIFRRDFKFIVFCVFLTGLFLVIIPVMVLGISHTIEFYKLVNADSARALAVGVPRNTNSQYFPDVLVRIWGNKFGQPWMSLVGIVGYLICGVNFLLSGYLVVTHKPWSQYWTGTLLFASIPFWVPTSWPHYFVYLPLLQIFILINIWNYRSNAGITVIRLLFWILGVILSNVIFFNFIGWQLYGEQGYLFWANLIVLLLGYSLIIRQMKISPARASFQNHAQSDPAINTKQTLEAFTS